MSRTYRNRDIFNYEFSKYDKNFKYEHGHFDFWAERFGYELADNVYRKSKSKHDKYLEFKYNHLDSGKSWRNRNKIYRKIKEAQLKTINKKELNKFLKDENYEVLCYNRLNFDFHLL